MHSRQLSYEEELLYRSDVGTPDDQNSFNKINDGKQEF